MKSVKMIVAHDENYAIGYKNSLPWEKNSEDMKWFKECTSRDIVVMGSSTWESLGCKKLPNRINVVVTSNPHKYSDNSPDLIICGSASDILRMLDDIYPEKDTVWIIGGETIYEQFVHFCNFVYVTKISGSYEADTFLDEQFFSEFYNFVTERKYSGCSMIIMARRK